MLGFFLKSGFSYVINWFQILTFQRGNILCLLGKLLLIIIILSNPFSGNAMALGFIAKLSLASTPASAEAELVIVLQIPATQPATQ